jgi:hypothetical protein
MSCPDMTDDNEPPLENKLTRTKEATRFDAGVSTSPLPWER